MSKNVTSRQFEPAQLEKYIESKVLSKIKLGGRKFKLIPTTLGNRNIIFFLSIDNFKDTVFKGFAKKYRIHNNLLGNSFLAQYGIDVPKIIFSDISQKTYRDFGCYFSCEEKIEGKSLAEIEDPIKLIPAVAGFYSKLHNIVSPGWGKLTSGRKYGFKNYLLDKVTKRLDIINKSDIGFDKWTVKLFSKWFEKTSDSLIIKNFSLSHGDVNKKNIMISDNNRVSIIDNETIKFLPFQIEFFRLKYILSEGCPDAQDLFEKSYFESCSPERLSDFEKCRYFYNAYVLFEFAMYYNRKLKDPKIDDCLKNNYESNLNKSLTEVKELISNKALL
jgi:thiamine kinase-like enzyme